MQASFDWLVQKQTCLMVEKRMSLSKKTIHFIIPFSGKNRVFGLQKIDNGRMDKTVK
jgi:hypothetical protein